MKRFIAFEVLMFALLAIFWAAAMAMPLFFFGAFKEKGLLWRSILIMWGPYLGYAVIRLGILLVRSVRWAYLVSNFLFTSDKEKALAEEWLRFVVLGVFWTGLTAYPLYLAGMFEWPQYTFFGVAFLLAPYSVYLLLRISRGSFF